MIGNDIIGWIMAWLPEGGTSYNFEFVSEKSRFCSIFCSECVDEHYPEKEYTANQYLSRQLDLLKSGKIKKHGLKVVNGYIMPVFGRQDV